MIRLSQKDLEDRFDDYLDELYAEIMIAGYLYPVSTILSKTDRVVYNEEFNNWLSQEIENENIYEDEDLNYYFTHVQNFVNRGD